MDHATPRSVKLALLICAVVLASRSAVLAQTTKPKLKVAPDGFPSGHETPEGIATDLSRAYIQNNVGLFTETCIGLYAKGEARTQYDNFMRATTEKMEDAAKQRSAGIAPAAQSQKLIVKVFAARHLKLNGPASYGYASFNFQDVMFVDIRVRLYSGKLATNRTLVIQEPDGKWYAHPAPNVSPLLSQGLNDESESVTDFSELYEVQK